MKIIAVSPNSFVILKGSLAGIDPYRMTNEFDEVYNTVP
jgi:hypothetical protein